MTGNTMKVAQQISDQEVLQKLSTYPMMRYMGSKHRLIAWIYDTLKSLEFDSALDAFSGSAVVSYLLKAMGKRVFTNDFLHFSSLIAKALIENQEQTLSKEEKDMLIHQPVESKYFISSTFRGIFYTEDELLFLDEVSARISKLDSTLKRALAYTALFRACIKKQPRGVFTVSGNLEHYDDGRRDLRLSLSDHFMEQVDVYNDLVFDNGQDNLALNQNIFDFDNTLYQPDLVYLDPPYVPRADDNCYVKRYHFLEGLSKYWEGETIMQNTKVKKIKKKFTPFSYRKTSLTAFNLLFEKFSNSTLVLSYSSNAYPDLPTLVAIMKRYKNTVIVHEKPYRYHFGNHEKVSRSVVNEYLIIGT